MPLQKTDILGILEANYKKALSLMTDNLAAEFQRKILKPELLQDYAGTLFLVSHDRAFLDNVVTQTIASEGEGGWKEYAGGYGDWQRVKSSAKAEAVPQDVATINLNEEISPIPGNEENVKGSKAATGGSDEPPF